MPSKVGQFNRRKNKFLFCYTVTGEPVLQFEIKALRRNIIREMTTFGQAEMEALGLMEKKHRTSVKAGMTMWRIAEIFYMITCSASYSPHTHPL